MEVPAPQTQVRGHRCKTDDFLVQNVDECTMEEIIEVWLIPQKCFREQSVQIDKVVPQERLLEQHVATEIREVFMDTSQGGDSRLASAVGHEADMDSFLT